MGRALGGARVRLFSKQGAKTVSASLSVSVPLANAPRFLFLLPGRPLAEMVVEPREPLVRYGDAVQLNCSLPCTGAMVQWKGLDTNLGSIDFFPTHSVLHINSAEVATEGTKICQGTCGEEHYQKSVNLKVYCKHPYPFPQHPPCTALNSPGPWEAGPRVTFCAPRGGSPRSPPGHAAARCSATCPGAGSARHAALLGPARVPPHGAGGHLVPGGPRAAEG